MLNVDALWREGGAADPPPPYRRAVSTGPLSPMIVAVTTAGGELEAGISYRTGAFESETVERIAAEVCATLRATVQDGRGGHGRIAVLPVPTGFVCRKRGVGHRTPWTLFMAGALTGKVALVSGAARGIGRAIALKLAREGCDVAANYYNSADEAEALCMEIRALGRRACAIPGSVGIPDSVDEIFAEFGKHFDRLDILVSNAASGVLKPTVDMTLKHWRWCMETNALALNLLTQRGLPLMTPGARDHRAVEPGRAASDAGLRVHRRVEGGAGGARAGAGAGVGPARHSREHGERGCRRHRRAAVFPESRGIARQFFAADAGGPVLTPQDVAGAVFLLCLPEAGMINGHTLVVDGGFAISG